MRISILIIVVIMLLASNLLAAEVVELKDVSGKYTIKAEINKVADGKVQVTDEKGKTSEYPLAIFDRDSLILILNVVSKMNDSQKPNNDSPLIIVNADGENVEIPPAPRSLEEVGELWLKALKAAESSERNGLAILSTLTWKEDEIKLAFEGYMRTDSPIPLAELTEAKERELFQRFSEGLKNFPNGWRKTLNAEKVAFSRNTSSWTHRVLTRVKWSEMKLLATVKSREPRISDSFGGLKMHSIVLFLSNGDELFWLWLDEAFQVDAVGEKWFYVDDLRNGRLRKGGTKYNYVDFVLKELRKRDDSSLSKLTSTLETLTPSGERRESSESVPPTESETLAALQIAKNEQFQEINLRGVPLTTKILSQLQEIPSITELGLDKSQLVDVDMIQLVGLKNLKNLSLRDNLLTESGIKHLSKMVSLEYLYLGNNPLGDKAIDHLVKMKNLRTLALDNTRVSPKGRAGLRNSLPHCSISPVP